LNIYQKSSSIQTVLSALEFNQINRVNTRLVGCTTGREFHPALKICLLSTNMITYNCTFVNKNRKKDIKKSGSVLKTEPLIYSLGEHTK